MVTRIGGFAFAACFWVAIGAAAVLNMQTSANGSDTASQISTSAHK